MKPVTGSSILVTGGAGYIGAHLVQMLVEQGQQVVVLDDLSSGFAVAVQAAELVVGDCGDPDLVRDICRRHRLAGVLHLAAVSSVEESTRDPTKYEAINHGATVRLLDVLSEHGAPPFIFSSTASVYEGSQQAPLTESASVRPLNPYGNSKLLAEQALAERSRRVGFGFAALRYFNVAGADPDGRQGDRRPDAHTLIPRVLRAAQTPGQAMDVFGRDYPTPDGTCLRDYIHVSDLCEAHAAALRHLWAGGDGGVFNLGYGRGFSVLEVIAAVGRVTGVQIPIRWCDRRRGDPAILVADSRRAKSELGWQPRHDNLDTIVGHAWRWQRILTAGADARAES